MISPFGLTRKPVPQVSGQSSGSTAWGDVTGKPTTFTPASHTHAIADTTGLQAALDGKAASTHSHAIGDVTGLQTALDGKAATSHSHVIGDVTGLQTALDAKVADADVRGGAASLNARLGTISNFASPNAGGVVVGQYYDNSFQGTASSTLAGAANRIDLAPYYTSVTLPINLIGVAVSTGVASALGKVVIYSAGSDGWPDELLFESGNLDFATTGYKSEALTFTFLSGVMYWLGVRSSSTATLRTINVSSAVNLGLTSSTASNYATILRRTVTFASAAPDPWTFTNSDRTANVTPPSIRFRAA